MEMVSDSVPSLAQGQNPKFEGAQRPNGTTQDPSSAAVFVDYVSLHQLVQGHIVDERGSFRAAFTWRCSQILCQALLQGKTENLSVQRDQLHNAGPRLRRSVRRLRVLASAGTTRTRCSRQLPSHGHLEMLLDCVPSLAQGQNPKFERAQRPMAPSRTPSQPQWSSTTCPCISWYDTQSMFAAASEPRALGDALRFCAKPCSSTNP